MIPRRSPHRPTATTVAVLAGLTALARPAPAGAQVVPLPAHAAAALAASPAASPAADAGPDLEMGDVFTSRAEGIDFRPPAGGTKLRQINSGEIVRYAYPDKGWTMRLKSAPNSTKLPLTAATGGASQGLLELTASLLTDRGGQPAKVLSRDVAMVGPRNIGLIEARDWSGINPILVQVAVIPDGPDGSTHYFVLQMVSPADDPKGAGGTGREALAREAFRRTLATLNLLDRGEFFQELKRRFYNTENLWVQLDRKHVEAALQPEVRYLRVVRDGKDVGYVQVNVRAEQHHGRDGFLVVARSHVEQLVQPPPPVVATPTPAGGAAAVDASKAGSVVDLMPPAATNAAGGAAPPVVAAAAAAGPQVVQVDRDARFFATFDHAEGHEDWTMVTRVNNVPGNDEQELGNSDAEVRRVLDRAATDRMMQDQTDPKLRPQPILTRAVRQVLRVDDFRGKMRSGQPFEEQLDPRYLPQAVAQLLPQLLPVDQPEKYVFAYYVSDQHNLVLRYVDVGQEQEVTLDGQKVRAVPIADRIGADGSDTIHYVDRRDNTYYGSVSDDGHLVVLPADEDKLASIWHGFKELPEPPPPVEDTGRTRGGRHSPALVDPQSFRGR